MLRIVTPELEKFLQDAERVTVISGPSGVGKSTLKKRLKGDPSVQAQFGLDGAATAWVLDPGLWEGLYDAHTRHMFLTYNHNWLWMREVGSYEKDEFLRALRTHDRVAILTMWEEPEVLLHRCNTRIRSTLRRIGRLERVRKHLYRLRVQFRLRTFCQQPNVVWQQYLQWLAFCDACNLSAHWTLRGADPSEMVTWSGCREPFWVPPTQVGPSTA